MHETMHGPALELRVALERSARARGRCGKVGACELTKDGVLGNGMARSANFRLDGNNVPRPAGSPSGIGESEQKIDAAHDREKWVRFVRFGCLSYLQPCRYE
jgi:hypothetical protein